MTYDKSITNVSSYLILNKYEEIDSKPMYVILFLL